MYNKVILMGRIANDLELKSTQNGASVLSFRLAVDRRYQPDPNDHLTDFFNIVAWRNNAEFISKYFSKGRMIHIDGELQTRTYDDKDGKTVYVTEVLVDRVSFTGDKSEGGTKPQTKTPASPAAAEVQAEQPTEGEDDDYPF
ncbi:MAG: single-stranded DNA-binding protein [Eubacterium sp.]|nr:single-stranded DNA-binding protein [Eubacterium sp.]